jgi:hypothetical protein
MISAIEREKLGATRTLAMQDCQLVVERDDLELQFRAAAKSTIEPWKKLQNECT